MEQKKKMDAITAVLSIVMFGWGVWMFLSGQFIAASLIFAISFVWRYDAFK